MASITCGRCKNTHGSAAEVRNCYSYDDAAPSRSTTVWAKENQASATGRTAVAEKPVVQEVPAGRYALQTDEGVKFYRVTKGKDGGRWAGYTFVEAQASDDHWPIRNAAARNAILRQIGTDVPAAMALYGKELGKCGHCGRTLTSQWRLKGIGPICAGKMGW